MWGLGDLDLDRRSLRPELPSAVPWFAEPSPVTKISGLGFVGAVISKWFKGNDNHLGSLNIRGHGV
jgi:hypothetical protein